MIPKRVNTEKMRNALATFDTDLMHVGRTLGDLPLDPFYSSLPCHIDFEKVAEPLVVTTEMPDPVVIMLNIGYNRDYDIQPNDRVTAFKMSPTYEILEVYTGTVGTPSVTPSRGTFLMRAMTTKDFVPPELPPDIPKSLIYILYKDMENGAVIHEGETKEAVIGNRFSVSPVAIANYEQKSAQIDGGTLLPSGSVTIKQVSDKGHTVTFFYESTYVPPTGDPALIRILCEGDYENEDGSSGYGNMFWGKIPVTFYSLNDSKVIFYATSLIYNEYGSNNCRLVEGKVVQILSAASKFLHYMKITEPPQLQGDATFKVTGTVYTPSGGEFNYVPIIDQYK